MSMSAKENDKRSGEFGFDEGWLDLLKEEIIDADRPIVDSHHHLWDSDRGARYLFEELLKDVSSGHNIRATVYAQCYSMFRADGDPAFAPIGEVEFVNGVAARSASGLYGDTRLCAGIVGYADLRLGSRVQGVLEAHLARAPERFKGIRYITEWDPDPSIRTSPEALPAEIMSDQTFREGLACLPPLGLTYDAWLFHHQLGELVDLARAFPETTMVLNHIGAPLNVGRYADTHDDVISNWRSSLKALGECPNVYIKVGGMNMKIYGFDNGAWDAPLTSEDLASQWAPYIEPCIEHFGVERSMFESNFPVDKSGCSYAVLWNAFKRLTTNYSEGEKAALFHDTAAKVYRLAL